MDPLQELEAWAKSPARGLGKPYVVAISGLRIVVLLCTCLRAWVHAIQKDLQDLPMRVAIRRVIMMCAW